ncbi:hypothetical protein C900_04699 [Fulvivirga imtechensis AK7]|uniref:Uncharacterized protein n=1 Tax=Fulvivirga imtechensis AK7 TaxID=1237149 RepID=L8JQU1_9BACT|nr:peptidase domain-containing ABC transporter [Fulvivirga imtechensis]ELR69722.1 hypothetical protein C900_04699 [Fulvivirga imtechensis AK7]
MNLSKLNKKFILQHGQSDCGPACLASIIQFHGGNRSLDEIRRVTGTSQKGTKLLGLYQGARQLGFDVIGLEAEGITNLSELDQPAILHVTLENRLLHYIVFYGFVDDKMIIGDPRKGISLWSPEQLREVWLSKSLLKLVPNQDFKKVRKRRWRFPQLVAWIKEDINILMTSLFLGVLIAIFSLATSIFIQKLIDVILPTKEVMKLLVGIVLFGFILLAKAALNFVRSTFLITQSRDFNNRMIGYFFKSLLCLPKPFFDSKKIGEMIARMNDARRIQLVVSNLAGNIIIEGLVAMASLAGVFFYSWQVGILVFSLLPIYIVILRNLNKPIITAQKDVMIKHALNEGNYIDVISGISEIKATATTELFHGATSLIYRIFQDSIFKLGKIQIKFNLRTELAGVLLMLAVMSFSAYLVIADHLMLGVMMAVLSLSSSIGPSLAKLAAFNIQFQEAKVAFKRMEEFTMVEKEMNDGEPANSIVPMEIKNLSFNFPGSLPLLKDISLKIEQGRITMLLGESGVGKSTILQLIQRFYEPVSGQIQANGKKINTIQLDSYRKQIAVVSQEIKIFNNYLLFNIALSEDPKILEHVPIWCQENGFDQFFSKFPQGYMTLLGEEGANISGGQRQLVGLARALFRKPDILLIDEGTSAMDRRTENFILEMLLSFKEEMAILLVTHRIKTASIADHIYILENGTVVSQGTPESLMLFDNFYSESYRELLSS